MIIKLSEDIFNTSLILVIGEQELLHKIDESIEIQPNALWTCYVEKKKWTIWLREFNILDLDHELTHFMAGVWQYFGLEYYWKDEMMTYLRWYYLEKILKQIKYKDLTDYLKSKWKKTTPLKKIEKK